MAEIDVKFMKGDRKLAKAMGSTYKAHAKPTKKTAKPKTEKK